MDIKENSKPENDNLKDMTIIYVDSIKNKLENEMKELKEEKKEIEDWYKEKKPYYNEIAGEKLYEQYFYTLEEIAKRKEEIIKEIESIKNDNKKEKTIADIKKEELESSYKRSLSRIKRYYAKENGGFFSEMEEQQREDLNKSYNYSLNELNQVKEIFYNKKIGEKEKVLLNEIDNGSTIVAKNIKFVKEKPERQIFTNIKEESDFLNTIKIFLEKNIDIKIIKDETNIDKKKIKIKAKNKSKDNDKGMEL